MWKLLLHFLFNNCSEMDFSKELPIFENTSMEYNKNMIKFVGTTSLRFNLIHCDQVQLSTALFPTKIYHLHHGFAWKNLSPQNKIRVSKSLDSLILIKTVFLALFHL